MIPDWPDGCYYIRYRASPAACTMMRLPPGIREYMSPAIAFQGYDIGERTGCTGNFPPHPQRNVRPFTCRSPAIAVNIDLFIVICYVHKCVTLCLEYCKMSKDQKSKQV